MRLVFDEILLSSPIEGRARRVRFHPKMTLIRGRNGTGKSSLLKALMQTFGASPAKTSRAWNAAGVRSLVRFRSDDEEYALLRTGDRYSLFREPEGALIDRFDSVGKGLALELAKIFNFHLQLPSQRGEVEQLPPAFYFLPYYMDQDSSWTNSWSGFSNLNQFPRWRKGVVEFHAGIRGNDYYEAQGRKFAASSEHSRAASKHSYLEEVYRDLAAKYEAARFELDLPKYEEEIRQLLAKCEVLRRSQEKFKSALVNLSNRKANLEAWIQIAKAVRREVNSDFEFSVQEVGEHVECPTCGAEYENSFREQFSIALDARECTDLVLQFSEELLDLEQKIREKSSGVERTESEIVEIQRILGHREGEIALADLIEQEGRRELKEAMGEGLQKLRERIRSLEKDIEAAKMAMKAASSPELRKVVEEYYSNLMTRACYRLGADCDDTARRSVTATIKSTGSQAPRTLFAYQTALMGVVEKFSTCVLAPLVVDTPRQQDQDRANYRSMLESFRDEISGAQQKILAVVDTDGFQFEGVEVLLDEKNRLLTEREFEDVTAELERYVAIAALGPRGDSLALS